MNFTPRIEIKKIHPMAAASYGTEMAAGLDLVACIDSPILLEPGKTELIGTGLAINMDSRHIAAMLLPRSGLGAKEGIVLGNLVGLVDGDYQGQVFVAAWNRNQSGEARLITPGERIAQMIFVPVLHPQLIVVDAFSTQTARGEGGFGSTGKH